MKDNNYKYTITEAVKELENNNIIVKRQLAIYYLKKYLLDTQHVKQTKLHNGIYLLTEQGKEILKEFLIYSNSNKRF